MFNNLLANTTNTQKLSFIAIAQIIVIAIIAALFNVSPPEITQEINIENSPSNIPAIEDSAYKSLVYKLLEKNFPDSNFENTPVTVRNDSYSETTSNQITTANFLVDIDEFKQTYAVSLQWSSYGALPNGTSVDCPKKQDMKYKETYCQGRYYNTDSIELYVPYEAKENGHTIYTLSINDENPFLIDVVIATCDDAEFNRIKTIAENYLTSSGINFSVYSYAFRQICLKN